MLPVAPNGTGARCCLQIGCQPAYHASTSEGETGNPHFDKWGRFIRSQWEMLQSYLPFPLVTNQIEVSAYRLENLEDGTVDLCLEKCVPPMVWSPLTGGAIFSADDDRAVRLRGTLEQVRGEVGAETIDEVLYAWLLVHPARMMPIVGSGKQERIERAVRALSLSLSREQWFAILQSSMGHDVP
ncbi:Oxidoreductase YdhF [[Flavobacterium] thermophilum]|nr:Oxidoreductase YdhF [Geobacillus sp. 12AMOR1]STO12272.1 Oxidoreductase YdhF [[Flavobacterium] thermophilum]